MAYPALGLVAKAAITALSDERLRNTIGWTVASILSPIILIIVILCGLLSATADHNSTALDLSFNGGVISGNIPEEYRGHIEDMRSSFTMLDGSIAVVNGQTEDGDSLDSIRVKAIFYSLYFGADRPSLIDHLRYVDCFVTYEKRTKTATDADGNKSKKSYTVAVPIKNLSEIYENISSVMGKTVTNEDSINAKEIYYRMKYGVPVTGEEGVFDDRKDLTPQELEQLYYDLPQGEKGSEVVKLAMSRLGDPYSQAKRGRGNYIDCSYLSMWCYRQIGIAIPGTAAEQARFCVNNGLTVAKKDLVAGDLVFWSHERNGRFMNITHVGVYAGSGKVIDASSTKGVVVYRNLFEANKQVLYGRPHILK